MPLPATLQKSLTATASIAVAELFSEGKSAANDPAAFPFAEISERLDGRTCPLCAAVDGMILKVGTPEYHRWRQPSHINCRRVLFYIDKDEAGVEADFAEPDADLIRKHGHYHTQPDKYAELRVPAEPSGRHFVVRRVKNPETGELRTVLDWAPWHDQVPEWKRELVLKARVAKDDTELASILEQLGITDTADPEQLRQATLLGLRDRVEGWITPGVQDRRSQGGPLQLPGAGKGRAIFEGLSEPARALWLDAEARRGAFVDIVAAYGRFEEGEPEAQADVDTALKRVHASVLEALEALGFAPDAPVHLIGNPHGPAFKAIPRKGAPQETDFQVGLHWMRVRSEPEDLLRGWVQDLLHARASFEPDYLDEYRKSPGYEEGVAEGLALHIVRDLAGLAPRGNSVYQRYVYAYEQLSAELDVQLVELLNRFLAHPVGAVRENFAREVERLYRRKNGRRLGVRRTRELLAAADAVFGKAGEWSDDEAAGIKELWASVLK